MPSWYDRLFRKPQRRLPTTTRAQAIKTTTLPQDAPWMAAPYSYIGLPNRTPFFMLPVFAYLRDNIPDVADGVWTWSALCKTGFDVEVLDASSNVAKRRAENLLADLNRRVNSGDRGMDGLLDVSYTSLFTYGAMAWEIVLSPSRESIADVVPVDVATVRFRREKGRLQAYQLHQGKEIKLPMERFIYLGLDKDGTNPYGRSMLQTLPFVVKIQQRLIEDMSKATHNMGWPKLHVAYAPGERARTENDEQFRHRVEGEFEKIAENLTGLEADQNLVTYDNVKVELIQGNQRALVFYDNLKAIEEQVITGMHLMPILLGRNYGTTETYGTAQFEIINRQVETVNRSIKRVLERLYNFELAMMWGEARAKVKMRSNRTVDVLREAQARAQEIDNALRLRDAGFVDHAKAAMALGIDS